MPLRHEPQDDRDYFARQRLDAMLARDPEDDDDDDDGDDEPSNKIQAWMDGQQFDGDNERTRDDQ